MIIKKNYPFLSTTPSTNIIFHPLFHYPIYPPPISSPLDTIPFYLLVSPLPLSLLLPLNVYLPISSPPLLTLIVPFLVLSLSPLINYTRLSSPPISNTTDTDPSALLISLPIPLSNPTDTNSLSLFLSFSSLFSCFFSCIRISPLIFQLFNTRIRIVVFFPTDSPNKYHILWHDRDTLGMDGEKIGVLEKCGGVSL